MNPRPLTGLLAGLTLLATGCDAPTPTRVSAGRAGDKPGAVDSPVEAHNGLAVALYGKLRGRAGNLVFSPTAVASSLASVAAGARGETAGQIGRVLRQPGGNITPEYLAFLRDLDRAEAMPAGPRLAPATEFRLADALWPQSGLAILPGFQGDPTRAPGAEILPIDFRTPAVAAGRVDAWFAQKTSVGTHTPIRTEDLTPDFRLIVTSAAHFRGNWDQKFASQETKESSFHAPDERQIDVPTMNGVLKNVRYLDAGGFQAIELVYSDHRFAMVAILPRAADGLASLEAMMTPYILEGILARIAPRDAVAVSLPKFSIRDEFSLDEALKGLGMPLTFGPSADLSGLTGPKGDLRLDRALHAAAVAFDEEGTEATASSVAAAPQGERSDATPPVFRADHPFLFLIRDLNSGAVVLLGRLVDPGQSASAARKGD